MSVMSIEEARAKGIIPPKTDKAGKAKALKCPGCDRMAALLKLLTELLDAGHDVRLEYRFHPTRKWRFDVAMLDVVIAIEIDGYGKGHYGIAGREKDNEKDATAQALGWRVLRVAWKHVASGEALAAVERMIRESAQEDRT